MTVIMDAITGDADVLAFVRAVMSKPSWSCKVLDAAIANKYASEAIAQGASSDSVNKALRQLQRLAADSKSAQSSSPRSATPDGAAVLPAETWAAIEKETARYRAYVATRMTEPDRTGRIALYAPVPAAGVLNDDPSKKPETVALDQPNQRPIAEAEILTVDEVSELLDYNSDATWSDCTCDGCQRGIQGTRYQCSSCEISEGGTWDLDSECYAKHMAGTLRVRQRDSEGETADPCPPEHRYFKMASIDALLPKLQEHLAIKNATEISQELHEGSVWAADNVVPEQLRQVLLSETARLAQDTIDYRSGSDGKVLDLIHPSLYPYIHRTSHVLRPHDPEVQNMMVRFACSCCHTQYQWLPADFDVDEGGNVSAASYINNLDESRYSDLYRAIPQILSLFIPMFEATLKTSLRQRRIQVIVKAVNYQLKPGQSHEGVWRVEGMTHESIMASGIYYYDCSPDIKDKGLSFRRARDAEADFPYGPAALEEYIGGELLPPYYAAVIRDSGMEDLPDQEELLEKLQTAELLHVSKVEPPPTVDLFTVATPPGRMLAFSNNIQHKVAGLYHAADAADDSNQDQTPYIPQASSEGFDADREEGNLPSKHYDPNTKPRFADNIPTADDSAQQQPVAERKILCFFLVDPEERILSSADIQRQQWDLPRARRLLDKAFIAKLGRRCPPELLLEITKHAGSSMTLAQAHTHRHILTQERKYERDSINIDFLREYSFSEE
ncbi:hypothetical protein RI367_005980 [Sorochytrium milnesiophthora]